METVDGNEGRKTALQSNKSIIKLEEVNLHCFFDYRYCRFRIILSLICSSVVWSVNTDPITKNNIFSRRETEKNRKLESSRRKSKRNLLYSISCE